MLIHIANILILLSFLVKEIMYLRILSIFGGFAFIGYFSLNFDTVQWSGILWNSFFILINLYQVIQLIIERRPIKFNERELQMKKIAFPDISDREWLDLLNIGEWKTIAKSNYTSSIFTDTIVILSDGNLKCSHINRTSTNLSVGSLIGGICYLTGETVYEDISCSSDIEMLAWNISDFRVYVQSKPQVSAGFQKLIGQEIIRQRVS